MRLKYIGDIIKENMDSISQIIFGGIFILAGLGKVINADAFIHNISNYKILPETLIEPFGRILPYIELTCGTLIILNIWGKKAAIILSVLLIIFIFAILSTILRGIDIECGCFSKSILLSEASKSNPWLLILRDIVFLIPGLIIVFSKKNEV